jgi:hypothetical protein
MIMVDRTSIRPYLPLKKDIQLLAIKNESNG